MGTPTKTYDMIDILMQDHRELEEMFRELESPGTDPDRRGQLISVASAELMRHWTAEQEHLHPAVREVLQDSDRLTDKEIGKHREAEHLLRQLRRMQPTDAGFDDAVRALSSEVREHIRGEEQRLFPRLREECSPAQLAKLGAKLAQAKRAAPARSRPSAPTTPPANKLIAPGSGLGDRVRDALRNRQTSPGDVR